MRENLWSKIEDIFNKAVVLPKNQRHEFVDKLCITDETLRDEILALLSEDDRENNVLNQSVFNLGINLLDEELEEILNEPDFASYKIKKLLGRGGMGAVFLGEDSRLERLVAIKIMPLSFSSDTKLVNRFQQEAKTASLISHPNVAHVYDFGFFKGRYFLVMEYIKGKTLREILSERKIELKETCEIGLELAMALNCIHKNGIIPRDVKPENIIVTNENTVKLLDFGLAKFCSTSTYFRNFESGSENRERISLETMPGILIGTAAYMSPEQIRGQKADERTDIWSFGAVLYEVFTGERPFRGETKSDIHAAILLKELEPIQDVTDFPEIKNIIEKCLKKDVAERLQTADEIISPLKEILRVLNSNRTRLFRHNGSKNYGMLQIMKKWLHRI